METMRSDLSAILRRAPDGISASAPIMTDIYDRVRMMNEARGSGPDCPLCRGKRAVFYINEGAIFSRDCDCRVRERSLERVRRSGLGELYELYTLGRFTAALPWQKTLRAAAEAYIAGRRGWLYVSGRSGSGKSHLICAIARALLEAGLETRYFMWRRDGGRLKAAVNEPEYAERMGELSECRVLVLDDLWKGGSITPADVNLAYELLNARYNVPSRLTLLSGELSLNAVCGIDEAVGGRIAERARGFVLETGDVDVRLVG